MHASATSLRISVAALCAAAITAIAPSHAAEPTYRNGVDMAFVLIPAGTFQMGSGGDDREATPAEKPRRRVTISKPFYLGRFEVTQAQWQAVMGTASFTSARSNPYYNLPGMADRLNKPDHPATVSWNEAQAFVQRLNAKEGHTRYRLPTEAEWEYAARAGTTTAYSFGNDASQLSRYAWFGEDFASGSTHAVGQKLPNPLGLHDVHGNVWEWVSDRYVERYDPRDVVDPQGPSSGESRVVRGGSWHQTSTSWRSAFRKPYSADYRGISIGFRVALESTP